MDNTKKPLTRQGDLAKLPRAPVPLIERPQWCVWRWTQKPDGSWQKPPYQAMQPDQFANVADSSTWAVYEAALDCVETRRADGISYILTESDPFAAIDLDHCRDVSLLSIDAWAQNFLDVGRRSYSEVTPSGEGCRIWGLAGGDKVNRKFTLEIDGKLIAAELFRRANKALTITGLTLNPTIHELTNIDRVIDWGVVWGERRKAAAAAEKVAPTAGNGFGNGCGYNVDEIEQIVRGGAPVGKNRSETFHTIVGHYLGCGWDAEQIFAHLEQFPAGIGGRYLGEGRLRGEIARSANKYDAGTLPSSGVNGWTNGFKAKAPAPASDLLDEEPGEADPEIDDAPPLQRDVDLDEELLEDNPPEQDPRTQNNPAPDPDLDEELDDLDEELEDGLSAQNPNLPTLYCHGDPDERPLKSWLIKYLMPERGFGLLSGQWGTGKTFVLFDVAASLMTGQPFCGETIKRQCGVLLIAAEGAQEVRLRLGAMVREKCGNAKRLPFRWYEAAPLLLQKGSTEKLIAMAKQADASLQAEFGLPLGLVIIDTLGACTGFTKSGEESDPAVGQAIMDVLKAVSLAVDCFVLGVAHFGKDISRGTRGASTREDAGDVVWVCLGEREVSGNAVNTRLAVRKHKGGEQGLEFPFTLRTVEEPEPDEDGDPITTKVVDWLPAGATGGGAPRPPRDPWAEPKRQDQKTAVLRLKRILMEVLADQGVDLPIPPDGPIVRMVDQAIVRAEFYIHTPVDGTPEQKRKARHMQFSRALAWAEERQLIGVEEIDEVTYLRLTRPDPQDHDEEEFDPQSPGEEPE